jgi:U4/U6 small nuclear ribonucleoprotein PRP31
MDGTTTTLADTLLDDLDDLSETENSVISHEETEFMYEPAKGGVLHDDSLHAHLKSIRERPHDNNLIIPSNTYLTRISAELLTAHQNLIQAYDPKFPDLAELVLDPKAYKDAVVIIRNETDITKIDLSSILSPSQIITVSVASSTTNGRPLTDEELVKVDHASQHMEDLWKVQTELIDFIKNRMNDWAPNTSALIGPSIAAKMVGIAGGLRELSRIPACNLQVLGQVKSNASSRAGLSTISSQPHTGILNECDLVQSSPSYLRKKVLKAVASKLALAIRCDFVNVDTGRRQSAASGESFRDKITEQIQQWQLPDKAKVLKALPK